MAATVTVGRLWTVTLNAADTGSPQPLPGSVTMSLYHKTPGVADGTAYVGLAPLAGTLAQPDVPLLLCCHWYVNVPEPFVTTELMVELPPTQIIGLLTEIETAACSCTITNTGSETGLAHPLPISLTTTR